MPFETANLKDPRVLLIAANCGDTRGSASAKRKRHGPYRGSLRQGRYLQACAQSRNLSPVRQMRRRLSGGQSFAVLQPPQVINDILRGREDRWLKSEEIWRCFWCANCYTVCPMDIPYPMLMMQMRYLAIEKGYGLKYFFPFKRFAMRAMEDGSHFCSRQSEGRERIRKIRSEHRSCPVAGDF